MRYIRNNAMKLAIYGVKRCKEMRFSRPRFDNAQLEVIVACENRHFKTAKYLARKGC